MQLKCRNSLHLYKFYNHKFYKLSEIIHRDNYFPKENCAPHILH